MKMTLQQIVLYLCGILLLLWDTNAECINGTTYYLTNADPHYFNLCENCQKTLIKCPPLTLYVQGIDSSAENEDCNTYYGGCSNRVAGCVPCQYFPWVGTAGSMTPPACYSVGPVAPYCDPSYYWYCSSVGGIAKLRACPYGYGFTASQTVGCTIWYMWNDSPLPTTPSE